MKRTLKTAVVEVVYDGASVGANMASIASLAESLTF